jgi:predicted PurR-regulated permease PerM
MTDQAEGDLRAPGRTERWLLAAARRIALFMAFLLFLGAIGLVVLAILPHFYNPGLFFEADTPDLSSFNAGQPSRPGQPAPQLDPNQDQNVVNAARETAAARAREEFERRLSAGAAQIFGHLSTYASTMEQAQPDLDALRDRLRGDVIGLTNYAERNGLDTTSSPGWDFLDGLAEQSGKLKDRAASLKTLARDDARRIDWQRFVAWYRDEFARKLQTDGESLQQQRVFAMLLKNQSGWLLGGAVSLIIMFLLFIILVVLLRTERNTRATEINTRACATD